MTKKQCKAKCNLNWLSESKYNNLNKDLCILKANKITINNELHSQPIENITDCKFIDMDGF